MKKKRRYNGMKGGERGNQDVPVCKEVGTELLM
jgi:hypothetical protein